MKYCIEIDYFYFNHPNNIQVARDAWSLKPITFASLEEAEKYIEDNYALTGHYYLHHNEYSPPDFRAVEYHAANYDSNGRKRASLAPFVNQPGVIFMQEIHINIDDVVSTGSLQQAIIDAGLSSDWFVAGGTRSPVDDWDNKSEREKAEYVLCDEFGAEAYVDPDDGTMATGGYGEPITWTDSSVIHLDCPSLEEAVDNPVAFQEMLNSPHIKDDDFEELKKRIISAGDILSM